VTTGREGLSIVVTPIQLSAILAGDNVSAQEALSNRLWGGVKIVGGAVELMGAAALLLVPEPTLLTKAGGIVLGVHGSDTMSTGLRQAWTGRDERTVTEQATAAAAKVLGANETQARRIGVAVDIAVPVIVASVAGAARIASIRAGRMSLAEHEAAGGHTIARHVGQTEAQLRARLIAEPRIPAASSFSSLRIAEGTVSEVLRANAAPIRAWAARAMLTQRMRITYDTARTIGAGVVRNTGALTQMNKVLVVLEKTSRNGKIYFVLTAFPIP
jgi:hypothetical protein